MIDLKPIFEHSQAVKQMLDSSGWQFLQARLQAELDVIDGKINDFMTRNRALTQDDIPALNELRAHKKDLTLFLNLKEELLQEIDPSHGD